MYNNEGQQDVSASAAKSLAMQGDRVRGGLANSIGKQEAPESALGQIDASLDVSLNRLFNQIERATHMVNRLIGGEPQPGNSTGGQTATPTPADLVSQLALKAQALGLLVNSLEHQIDRLQPITG